MKHFWNWTFQFVVNLFGVGIGVVLSFYLLDLRDKMVDTTNEDPIWEFVWCIMFTAAVTALTSCTANNLKGKEE